MIKFCSPLVPDMDVVRKYLDPSFKSGYLSNFGQAYERLRSRLHTYLGIDDSREIVLVSSGHVALQASYYVLGVNHPAITDYTFRSTLCSYSGMFNGVENSTIIDCDDNGFLDIEKMQDGYTDCFVLVCPLSRIPDIQKYEKTRTYQKLIIDGAATFGTKGIYNYGDCFCLSFHATKTFPIGEGGAVICSRDVAKKIKQYINFGFDEHKNAIMNGTNGKISEYSCAIGLAILDQIEADNGPIQKRIRIANIYNEYLKDSILPSFINDTVYQTFPIYMKDKESADIVRGVLKSNNVEFLQYYKPLIGMKNSKSMYDRNICLPCHQDVSIEQAQNICRMVLETV